MKDQKYLDVDLSSLDCVAAAERGYQLELLHPGTGQPMGWFVMVIGKDAQAYRDRMAEVRAKAMDRVSRMRSARQAQKDGEADGVELLAAAIRGWGRGDKSTWLIDGQEKAFSDKEAREVFSSPKWEWAREQVAVAIQDRANFFPTSA